MFISSKPIRRLAFFALSACALAACGEDDIKQPEFDDLQINCKEGEENQGVRGPVIEEVRVHVSDPNRNLLGVSGTINGIVMELEDPEGDSYFSWFPAGDSFPMVCEGDFQVELKASDADGNTTLYSEIITK